MFSYLYLVGKGVSAKYWLIPKVIQVVGGRDLIHNIYEASYQNNDVAICAASYVEETICPWSIAC
jgi:hypothetical protein